MKTGKTLEKGIAIIVGQQRGTMDGKGPAQAELEARASKIILNIYI